jgi:hypothetical protein
MSWHNRLAAVPVTYSRGVHVKRNPIWLELNEQCIFISLFDRLIEEYSVIIVNVIQGLVILG